MTSNWQENRTIAAQAFLIDNCRTILLKHQELFFSNNFDWMKRSHTPIRSQRYFELDFSEKQTTNKAEKWTNVYRINLNNRREVNRNICIYTKMQCFLIGQTFYADLVSIFLVNNMSVYVIFSFAGPSKCKIFRSCFFFSSWGILQFQPHTFPPVILHTFRNNLPKYVLFSFTCFRPGHFWISYAFEIMSRNNHSVRVIKSIKLRFVPVETSKKSFKIRMWLCTDGRFRGSETCVIHIE